MAEVVLRFYETLDVEVQASWRLLRRTLLTKYPPPDPSIPAPALAASLLSRDDALFGVIRLDIEGNATARYLAHGVSDHITRGDAVDRNAATVFKLRRSGGVQPIRFAKYAAWLGLRWYIFPTGRTAPDTWASFTCVVEEADSAGCNNRSGYGPGLWVIWKYEQTTGLLEACWPEDNGNYITETHPQTGFDAAKQEVFLYKNVDAYNKRRHLSRMKTRLIFVPL